MKSTLQRSLWRQILSPLTAHAIAWCPKRSLGRLQAGHGASLSKIGAPMRYKTAVRNSRGWSDSPRPGEGTTHSCWTETKSGHKTRKPPKHPLPDLNTRLCLWILAIAPPTTLLHLFIHGCSWIFSQIFRINSMCPRFHDMLDI